MTRKLHIAIFVFALAAMLLPHAAFAADSRPVCINEADPRVCAAGAMDRADARLQAQIEALSHTYPAAASAPAYTPAAGSEALNASHPAAASASAASLQAKIAALSATYPSARLAPVGDLAAQIEALSATYPAAASAPTANLQAKIAALSATYPSAGLAPARKLSDAELQYHRETMARMDLVAPAASVELPIDTLTSLELDNRRNTTEHTDLP